MIALVIGGASSGKSAFAEKLALSFPGPHVYAATMRHGDAETERRIARHRRMREGAGFITAEIADGQPCPREGRTVLLEDLGNLVANDLDKAVEEVLSFDNAVFVGNDVGRDGYDYGKFTRAYIERIGALSCAIAQRADLVVEVVAGIPRIVKDTSGRRAEPTLASNPATCVKEPGSTANGETRKGSASMVLITGGIATGKRSYAHSLGFTEDDIAFIPERGLPEELPSIDDLAEHPVVICTDIGAGIVPLDRTERAWREEVGRLTCALAERADAVVHMVCGIPSVLKGVPHEG